jgi:hypothetical protein
LALLLLAACGSSGGMGDIFGGGTNQNAAYEIRGVVDSVDTNGRSVYLTNVSGLTNMLSNSGSGSTVRVYYDADTPVDYNGKTYRPEDLERGDEVTVRVDESGNRLMADRMTVTRDVSSGSTSGGNNNYQTNIRGTVRYVDTSRRTIEVDRGTGSTVIVEFDNATPVYFNNTTYRTSDLERGDEIDIRVRDLGNGRYAAQDITVTRNVSGSSSGTYGGSTSSQLATFRGTVRSVNTSNRTIELDSTSWISGFTSGAGSGTMIVSYDTNTSVDVSGRLYPVTNLERGDVIEVQARRTGSSGYFAERLILVRDANSR